jgi:hypothetical protein
VETFEQMKQRMEEAQKKAQQQQAKGKPSHPQGGDAQPLKMNFKVSVRNTAAPKKVAGLDTKESILSMELEAADQQSAQKAGLAITNDMWLAPEIPGYSEVRDFNKRLALKMGMVFGDVFKPTMAAMQAGSGEGMAKWQRRCQSLRAYP